MTRRIIISDMICILRGYYLKIGSSALNILHKTYTDKVKSAECCGWKQVHHKQTPARTQSSTTLVIMYFLVFSLRPDPVVSESSARRSDNLYCAQHPLVSTLSSYFLLINLFIDIYFHGIFLHNHFLQYKYLQKMYIFRHTHLFSVSSFFQFTSFFILWPIWFKCVCVLWLSYDLTAFQIHS